MTLTGVCVPPSSYISYVTDVLRSTGQGDLCGCHGTVTLRDVIISASLVLTVEISGLIHLAAILVNQDE